MGRLGRRADESECALNLPTNINAKIKSAIGVMRWNCRAIVRVLQIAQCPVSIRGIGYDRRGKMPAMSLVRMCEPFVARCLRSIPKGQSRRGANWGVSLTCLDGK